MAKLDSPVCMTDNCSEPATTRGLCPRCYSTAGAAVKKGQVTWDELVEMGLVLASKRVSNGVSPFGAALASKLPPAVNEASEATTGGAGSLPWIPEDEK